MLIASRVLLALVLVKKYKFITLKQILNEINQFECIDNNQKIEYASQIYNFIKNKKLYNAYNYEDLKNKCRYIDIMIDHNFHCVFTYSVIHEDKKNTVEKPAQKNINQDFYNGFQSH